MQCLLPYLKERLPTILLALEINFKACLSQSLRVAAIDGRVEEMEVILTALSALHQVSF